MNLFLIEGIGPFFRDDDRARINRSKIPCDRIKYEAPRREAYFAGIRKDFEEFCRRGYRVIDSIFTMHLLSFAYRAVHRARPRRIPKFARKSAMGIDTVFR